MVTCTLHPNRTAPRTGTWPFSHGCCPPPVSSHERPGALSLPTKPHSEATWLIRALHTPRS